MARQPEQLGTQLTVGAGSIDHAPDPVEQLGARHVVLGGHAQLAQDAEELLATRLLAQAEPLHLTLACQRFVVAPGPEQLRPDLVRLDQATQVDSGLLTIGLDLRSCRRRERVVLQIQGTRRARL
ncbi:hypothetical protein D3C76_1239390 [compost metagenome]